MTKEKTKYLVLYFLSVSVQDGHYSSVLGADIFDNNTFSFILFLMLCISVALYYCS